METPSLISGALMEETWRKVATSSEERMRRLQTATGREQEELTGFVIGYASNLRPDVMGIVLYAHIVIAEAFRKSGVKLRRIKAGRIVRTWKSSAEFVADLKLRGRDELIAAASQTDEPAVFEYIVGALTEPTEDSIELTETELWHAVHVLKTVMDCMHAARKGRAA